MENRITPVPPRLVTWRGSLERRPYCSAAALGACLGILSVCCALLVLGVLLQWLPPEQWGESAASGLARLSQGMVFFLTVLYAPVIESFMAQLVPIELARRLGAHPAVCVLLSGLVFGYGHYSNGGLAHGITTFFSGLVFGSAYLAPRRVGVSAGFLAASSAHAVHNLLLLFVIAPLLPGAL